MARRQRKKQSLARGDSVTLPKAQQQAVLALVAQRERVKSEASLALVEIGEALMELAALFAMKAGLREDARYDFETRGQAVVLARWKESETEEKNGSD